MRSIRVVLDVVPADGSLSGRASVRGGESRSFTGWIGLLAALEALLPVLGATGQAQEEQRLKETGGCSL